ncbi:MAG: YtxH domain-containing protein [Bryobacteraceae bacterium]|nr:YtxH domain-containing protein [Bryobacteraceae bacterium]
MNGNGSTALPFFLAGVGVGIAFSLLFAPRSGPVTRDLISRKVKDGEGWVKARAAEAEEYVHAQGVKLRDRAEEVAEVISQRG